MMRSIKLHLHPVDRLAVAVTVAGALALAVAAAQAPGSHCVTGRPGHATEAIPVVGFPVLTLLR